MSVAKEKTMAFKKRYILAQEAEERIVSLFRKERNDAAEIFNTAIDACQSIILDMYDNAPDVVERKVGKWIVIMDEQTITFDECKCSECGVVEYFNKGWKKFNYCPNCGCLMKGEKSDLGRDKDDSRDY